MPTLEEELEAQRLAFEEGANAAVIGALYLLFPGGLQSKSHAVEARGPMPVWLLRELMECVVSRHFTPARSRRDRERWNDQIRYFWVKLLRLRGVKWEDVYEQAAIELRREAPESSAGEKAIKDSYLRERRKQKKRERGS